MICAVIKGPSYEQACQQIKKALPDANLLELRLDLFNDVNIEKIKMLQKCSSLPLIFTLRPLDQGGSYKATKESRLQTILFLAKLKPEYIDLEYDVPNEFIETINKAYPQIKIILSYHDFTQTPANFDEVYALMKSKKASLYKMAFMAKNGLDCFRFLKWAKSVTRPLIAISMGEPGQISRIIAPILGSPMTYACVENDLSSVLGQLTAKLLNSQYHYKKLNSHTSLYGLIGFPVDTSVSDITHNAIFSEKGYDAVYLKTPVKLEELESLLEFCKTFSFKGLSITMPLKEAILPYLDFIEPQAKEIKAVNTLVFDQGNIKGYNTDGLGALNAIEKQIKVKNKRVLILGAGGAAKAIAYEAYRRGGFIIIVNRDVLKAKLLAASCNGCYYRYEEIKKCIEEGEGYDILVNTTPIELPIEPPHILSTAVIMDIKTKPKVTELLKIALEKKARVIFGYEMFVEQAIAQFNLWFNHSLNPQQCHLIFENKLKALLK